MYIGIGYFWLLSVQCHSEVIWCHSDNRQFCISKTAVEENGVKFRNITNTYIGYIWPYSVQGHFGVIRWTCLKIACISKTDGRRATRTEIWDSWILLTYIWDAYNPVGSKVILWSFSGLFCFKMARKSKMADRRRKRLENWNFGIRNSGNTYYDIWGIFNLVWFKVTWGHLGSFGALVLKYHVTRKMMAVVQMEWNVRLRGTANTYMGYIWPCSVEGHLGGGIRCIYLKLTCVSKTVSRRVNLRFEGTNNAYRIHLTL